MDDEIKRLDPQMIKQPFEGSPKNISYLGGLKASFPFSLFSSSEESVFTPPSFFSLDYKAKKLYSPISYYLIHENFKSDNSFTFKGFFSGRNTIVFKSKNKVGSPHRQISALGSYISIYFQNSTIESCFSLSNQDISFKTALGWYSFEEGLYPSITKRHLHVNPYIGLTCNKLFQQFKLTLGALSYLGKSSRKNIVINYIKYSDRTSEIKLTDNSVILYRNFYLNYFYTLLYSGSFRFTDTNIQAGYSHDRIHLNMRYSTSAYLAAYNSSPTASLSGAYKISSDHTIASELSYTPHQRKYAISGVLQSHITNNLSSRIKISTDKTVELQMIARPVKSVLLQFNLLFTKSPNEYAKNGLPCMGFTMVLH